MASPGEVHEVGDRDGLIAVRAGSARPDAPAEDPAALAALDAGKARRARGALVDRAPGGCPGPGAQRDPAAAGAVGPLATGRRAVAGIGARADKRPPAYLAGRAIRHASRNARAIGRPAHARSPAGAGARAPA